MQDDRPLLAIDIGNTQVVVGLFVDGKLVSHYRLTAMIGRTADELLPMLGPLIEPHAAGLRKSKRAIISSVVPSLTDAYEGYARRHLGAAPILVSAALPIRLKIDVPDPMSVGADRIADAVAVAGRYRLPAIVVDLGTATTFDVVLPGPRYVGGVIAPGLMTSAEELFRRGARLAKVELRLPKRVGRTTEQSIQSGVLYGAAGQIDGIVTRIRREMAMTPTVVATGGLAELIAPICRTLKRVDSGLTLHGLRMIDEQVRRAGRGKSGLSRARQGP